MPRALRTLRVNWSLVPEGLILAIDQGTGSSKAIVVDARGAVVAHGSASIGQVSVHPGWVEQDPHELIASVRAAVHQAMAEVTAAVVAVGISNQRESLLAWNRATGEPVTPVVSWQDRRTVDLASELNGHAERVRQISGLPLDPMFSALKAAWIVRAHPELAVQPDEYCLGTVDSWLRFCLTGTMGIECGNASRTSLLDLSTGDWSDELLGIFGIPRALLPPVTDSVGDLGVIRDLHPAVDSVPLSGILGDSHAALFAHAGWRAGVAKATYGTGSSVMTCAEDSTPGGGMCRTIAWRLPGARATVALEANILSVGSTLTWLADVLGSTAGALADSAADDSEGIYLVPAFNGLGAPWWDQQAQALLVGMSLGSGAPQLARAALDSIIMQVRDVLCALQDVGIRPSVLIADGGITANSDVMRRQASVAGTDVLIAAVAEASALGAAHAAGMGIGMWSLEDLESLPRHYDPVDGSLAPEAVRELVDGWSSAVRRSRSTD